MDWRDLREAILHQFSGTCERDPTEKLMPLRQGRLVEYREEFETLAVTLQEILEKVFRSAFLNRLTDDIRAEVRMH